MEMRSFLLPDLGEGLAESEIVQWHVNVGDMVKVDQIILTVETAKAVVEVPAPYSGKIVSRHGEEGDVINIGSLLLEIEEEGATNKVESKQKDAATVVGNVSSKTHQVDVDDFWIGASHNTGEDSPLTAMPSARLLAKKLGVDLLHVKGSGHDGMITDADIYEEAGKQQPGTEVLKGARRTMVGTMAESHHNVASVTITEEALLENWNKGEDISGRLIQAVVHACEKEPALNAWFDAETMTRCVHSAVNIGIAVDSSHGLYVPVLRNANEVKTEDIRSWLNETVTGIRDRKIGREQLQHATITLSNFGAIAGIYATPVVSPPQVAIVGAGRIIEKVVMRNNEAVAVKAMPLSVTFDHRACTGGEAARFTKLLVEHLEMKLD
ncbi:branched-chain alpha-keto acid dehydrogenase subunit E2 [Vibrio coralliilyticus]|jgi:pyruvate dehydrogenase E2 component (dihydrolipoamide acetyltransferase)|uniref:Dihydrolipoamide acetyltransferase component of pyruvate dehydrogenase complex n=2 Tax=Vibrionaceae TaxID=641 RepID=A0A0A0SY75_9VIBR|nr:branched-chain alpha-keto acid dehydrogenase subunit E2 [Vibrio coralliilyticus]EEX33435.1 dihydrolipoamide acyltransferase component of branched-chain alpha-keto acid dehydrogenase complex [Vibrio coralliilyticus ATCC BAA-450]ERB66025.1 branched-chain alpha-keto acid dehydrogenase subunit E2 [Vibrio coralliilyticus OCN008]ARC94813.1 branched-chain alpha-keto acid dehydrogenase subunit E2 [Vibrio coralliilyticus]AXN33189.1 2-oxo acid dehydrogenase subunit E2 [Vibrio coralliilyticus]